MTVLPKGSLFTKSEKEEFITTELALLTDAKFGDFKPLIKFLEAKKDLMLVRSARKMERVLAQ